MSTTEPDIWVVVCENDVPHPRWGVDERGPIVHETYVRDATRENALAACRRFKAHGACRIARLVFDDQPTTNQETSK